MGNKYELALTVWRRLTAGFLLSVATLIGVVAPACAAEAAAPDSATTPVEASADDTDTQTVVNRTAPDIDLKEVAPAPAPTVEPPADTNEVTVRPQPEPVAEAPTPTPDITKSAASFSLLGSDIRPGISTRLAWSPNIQIAGLSQPTPVLV